MIFQRVLEATVRREHGRLLSSLVRRCGRLDLAEEALQDAYVKAHETWPSAGIPSNAAAWLSAVARNRLIDLLRRDQVVAGDADQLEQIAHNDLSRDDALDSGINDDQLRLLFACCHPAIAPAAATALALNTLCGLSVKEISRAFVEPEATTAQRLVRAKRKIRDAGIPFEIPRPTALSERLTSVLSTVYLVFNEGYAASTSATLSRADLCAEALRLGSVLYQQLPDQPECAGLYALMLLSDARRDAREKEGTLVPLEEQDRSLWNAAQIAQGTEVLDSAIALRAPGPYQIQAAIAALHCQAVSADATDWAQIAHLYFSLLHHQPTPIVELNAAVAVAMSTSIDAGLEWIAKIEARGELQDYHWLHAAKADLLRRAGRARDARESYAEALTRCRNEVELNYLAKRLRAIDSASAITPHASSASTGT